MKRKYYYILAVIIVLIATIIIPSIQKSSAPEPNFPITEEIINAAIKNAGLEMNLGEKTIIENLPYNITTYSLMNKNNKMVGIFHAVDSSIYRMITMSTFYEETELTDIFPKEDYAKIISVTTEIYGGFSDKNKIYKEFSKDIMRRKYKGIPSEYTTHWDKKYNNIICCISIIDDLKKSDMPLIYQVAIMNKAMRQEVIKTTEDNIKRTEEKFANFPKQNTKKAREQLNYNKKRLKKIK